MNLLRAGQGRGGFTLLEVLIALVVLGFGLLGFAAKGVIKYFLAGVGE